MKCATALPFSHRVFALFLLLFLSSLALTALTGESSQNALRNGAPLKTDARITALVEELGKVREFHQVALSPDGRNIAWVVDSTAGGTEIEVVNLATPAATRRVTSTNKPGGCDQGAIAWAPDGKQFAFLSDCNSPGQMQIYLTSTTPAQTPRQVGRIQGLAQSLEWSPDGKSVGFLYVEGATRRAGALDAMKPPSGVVGEDGVEIQRVAAVNASTGDLRFLTPADLHAYEFDWSPDSKQLAYVAATPPGENNWWIAQLYTQPVGSPQPKSLLDPNHADSILHGLQLAVPRWSPDGKHIALIGGLMSDQGSTGGDIYLMTSTGQEIRKVLGQFPDTFSWLSWQSDRRLTISEIRAGSSRFFSVDLDNCDDREEAAHLCIPDMLLYTSRSRAVDEPLGGSIPASISDGRMEMSLSSARNGAFAFIESSFAEAPEVYLWKDTPVPIQMTHYNDALKPMWGKAESVEWKSDKFEVQGWLLYPVNFDAAKKYPMIVSVHGGPAAAQLPSWPNLGYNATAFSALDYFVLFPNPRGSYGQGESFTMANRKDFGYGDLRDIVAGVDAVVTKYPVDSTRVGLTGWSYGGFMTMFAVTQTQRFRAAVAGAGISNWQSYYGQNSIDQWMVPYFGASVYNDPDAYARSSAIHFIRQAKTPTLVVVGDRDGECPAPQSYEFWHALREQHVPTRLVIYPNEGHRFVSPDHRRDVLERALEWFNQYMPAQP